MTIGFMEENNQDNRKNRDGENRGGRRRLPAAMLACMLGVSAATSTIVVSTVPAVAAASAQPGAGIQPEAGAADPTGTQPGAGTTEQPEASTTADTTADTTAQTSTQQTTGAQKTASRRNLSVLEKKLKAKIAGYGGTWSVYVKDLKANKALKINNRKMYAASLIKLYAMGAAYESVRKGKLKASSISGLLSSMITVSENEPFNTIVQMVGKAKVNRWIRKNGFRKTKVVHDVGLAANSTIVRSGRKGNTTTVVDCGKFLEMVYRGKCVNKRYSKLMLKLLKKQQRRDKIPAGVPSRVVVANKTGETDEVSHDAAIVYAKKAPYIIVVMVTDPGSAWTREEQIAELSSITYQFFTGK